MTGAPAPARTGATWITPCRGAIEQLTLTVDRYTHAYRSDQAGAVTKLPSLGAIGNEAALRKDGNR